MRKLTTSGQPSGVAGGPRLAAQERWVHTLRRHIDGLQDEVSAYGTMLALGRDERLLRVLEDLYDRHGLFERASDDPRGFFEARSVGVPDNATVTVTVTTVTVNRGRGGTRSRHGSSRRT